MSPKVINILHENIATNNGVAFTFPLFVNRRRLKEYGFKLNFINTSLNAAFDCDVLIVTSKFALQNEWWKEYTKQEMFKFLESAERNVNHVLWADLNDGSGTTHFEILPFVHRYLKGSVLKSKKDYQRLLYGSRFFTDYYHNKFGVHDDDPGEPHLNYQPPDSELHKIYISWNSALYNYSYCGRLWRKLNNHIPFLPKIYFKDWTSPKGNRPDLLSCRIGTKYSRNTVSFQRRQVLNYLKGRVQEGTIRLRHYLKELRNSRVALSPFGWGEICYRDFEIIICGATLLKPDCHHMETWPKLYIKDKTYIPFKWDFSDFHGIIESLLDREKELIEIAQRAQETYHYYLFSREGRQAFCERFSSLVSF